MNIHANRKISNVVEKVEKYILFLLLPKEK